MTDSPSDAKKCAFRLLGYRARSEAELRERLSRKGFSDGVISAALEDLRGAGYLNDLDFAADLKRQLLEGRLLGHRGAERQMAKRGLSREVIESVLEYDESQELRNAQKLLDKKAGSVRNYLSEKEKARLWSYLARRGYSSGIIKKVMKDVHRVEEERNEDGRE